MKESTNTNGKPLLDAESFQKLLAAAYVLQEHNDQARGSGSAKLAPEAAWPKAEAAEILDTTHLAEVAKPSDYPETLAEIVSTQRQIHMAKLGLQDAMNLIADRTRQIARASGTAVGMLQEQKLVYRAASGSASALRGTKVDVDSCFSVRSLTAGESFKCANANGELNAELCRKYGVKALITVPIFYEGQVAGSLELHSASPNAFREHDVRTCQLMAGLVTEAMSQAAEMEWKQTLAAERATMLEALDRLKPQLQRLAGGPEIRHENSVASAAGTGAAAAPARDEAIPCAECGNPLDADQLFCGQCGTERPAKKKGDLQSKWASMWDLSRGSSAHGRAETAADSLNENQWPGTGRDLDARPATAGTPENAETSQQALTASSSRAFELQSAMPVPASAVEPPAESALKRESDPLVSPAAISWLRSEGKTRASSTAMRLWRSRRADIYLVVAVILVIVAMRWIIWSKPAAAPAQGSSSVVTASGSSPSRSTARRKKPPEPKLTLMEQLLVSLGLAEPPPAATYMGNPNTQVWVDLHTALYYCPGADLYGKTPKGKFTSQRDAQLDQFEPAYRQACD